MAERYLIDTSLVIKYLNNSLPQNAIDFLDLVLDIEINISFVTKIELLVWNPANPGDLIVFNDFINNANLLLADDAIISKTIEIRKATKIKLPDALIAGTALSHNFTLIADNDKDFDRVVAMGNGFKYLNPLLIM